MCVKSRLAEGCTSVRLQSDLCRVCVCVWEMVGRERDKMQSLVVAVTSGGALVFGSWVGLTLQKVMCINSFKNSGTSNFSIH